MRLLLISIHAPRVGSDFTANKKTQLPGHFNPRSPCGERPAVRSSRIKYRSISIHAPRVGSDGLLNLALRNLTISIHAPRVGSDRTQSSDLAALENFNPRSPCGERLGVHINIGKCRGISIHAPRVGSDLGEKCLRSRFKKFQSTLPVWGATPCLILSHGCFNDFNPRSPCGERLCQILTAEFNIQFQSTLPVWGATTPISGLSVGINISIHAPRVGSDRYQPGQDCKNYYFNPRSPCGERPAISGQHFGRPDFNPRSPCGERLDNSVQKVWSAFISIHAPRVGSDKALLSFPGG